MKFKKKKKNELKLQKRFDDENIPLFIQRYFINIASKVGAINYWIAIRDLLLWLMEKKIINKDKLSDIVQNDFFDVESEDVTLYLRSKEQVGMSPTTLETRKNIFSSFWKYLKRSNKCPVKQNIIEYVAYKGISSNNNLVKKLPSEDQLRAMEEKIIKKPDGFIRKRNLVIFRVLKGSGIREGELAGLDISDVFLNEDMPYIKIIGKGKYREIEARQVFLTGDVTDAIVEWIEYRKVLDNIFDENALFLNKNGKRLTEDNIKAIFKNYGNGVTCHQLRHYYATIIAHKVGLAFAQQQLGHTSLDTTINNYANGSYGMKDVLLKM